MLLVPLRFWEHYLEQRGDRELLVVAARFFAFRCLVIASPLWYPALPESVRRKLFAFMPVALEVVAHEASVEVTREGAHAALTSGGLNLCTIPSVSAPATCAASCS